MKLQPFHLPPLKSAVTKADTCTYMEFSPNFVLTIKAATVCDANLQMPCLDLAHETPVEEGNSSPS